MNIVGASPLPLAVILGSDRQGRFGPTVATWVLEALAEKEEFEVDFIDLANPTQLSVRLARAGAFIIVTPEYNHSFPAVLKAAIDEHRTEWHAKPIGFVSYGGLSGGLRAVEHLRLVFAELHAVTLRDTVSFHAPWETVTEDGSLPQEPGSTQAVDTLISRLTWWGHALQAARTSTPYAA